MATLTRSDPRFSVTSGASRLPTLSEREAGFPCGAVDRALFNGQEKEREENDAYVVERLDHAAVRVMGVQNDPPVGPAVNDRYITGPAPTGAWAGQPNKIAWYGPTNTVNGWIFYTPVVGVMVTLRSGTKFASHWFDGTTWRPLASLNTITTSVILNIAATGGAAVPVDPLAGNPFDSLANCLAWLSDYSITGAGFVSIRFTNAAVLHTISVSVTVKHPNSDRIELRGATRPGAFPVAGDAVASKATSRTNIRAKMGTVLSITGGARLTIQGGLAGIYNIMFDHDGTAGGTALSFQGGQTVMEEIVIFGSSNAGANLGVGAALGASLVWSAVSLIAHCDLGVVGRQGGDMTLSSTMVVTYCANGVDFSAANFNASGASTMSIAQCTTTGLNTGDNGLIFVLGSITLGANNQANNRSTGGRIILTPGAYASGAVLGASAHIATRGGRITAPNTGAVTCSPVANTLGNANSYIELF